MQDLISRQAAIDVAMQDVSDKRSHDFNAGATRAANRIKLLPSVEAIPISWLENFRDGLDTLSENRLMLAIDLIIDAYRGEKKRKEE